jgi:hypothetical protein
VAIPYSYADFFSHELRNSHQISRNADALESTRYFYNAFGARLLKLVDE